MAIKNNNLKLGCIYEDVKDKEYYYLYLGVFYRYFDGVNVFESSFPDRYPNKVYVTSKTKPTKAHLLFKIKKDSKALTLEQLKLEFTDIDHVYAFNTVKFDNEISYFGDLEEKEIIDFLEVYKEYCFDKLKYLTEDYILYKKDYALLYKEKGKSILINEENLKVLQSIFSNDYFKYKLSDSEQYGFSLFRFNAKANKVEQQLQRVFG